MYQTGKEVKLPLFEDHVILYIFNLKDPTKKLLELINEFSKVPGHKIDTLKSIVFLYTSNKQPEMKLIK